MQSIFFCQKCTIDFACVSSYIKHRKHFCDLGKDPVSDTYEPPEDGIGKLTIQEAGERIKRALESKIEDVDPEVFEKVELIHAFKRSRKELGKIIFEERGKVLDAISELKKERTKLETEYEEKFRTFENERAYLSLSDNVLKPNGRGSETGEQALDNLKRAMQHLDSKISEKIGILDTIERGDVRVARSAPPPAQFTPALSSPSPPPSAATTVRAELPLLPPNLGTATTAALPSHRQLLQPRTADSVIVLEKLRRKRDILLLQRELSDMEKGPAMEGSWSQNYSASEGLVVCVDYLAPVLQIPVTLRLVLIRKQQVVSQTASFVVVPSPNLTFLGYHETFVNIPSDPNTFLLTSVQTSDGEELGWCLLALFPEGSLAVGCWRLTLKAAPFSPDLVSSLYHGVKSLNYSIRVRVGEKASEKVMLGSGGRSVKLAHYTLHNPAFNDNLILTNNLNSFERKHKFESRPADQKVAETYGPPGEFDPVKVLKSGGSRRVATRVATPAPGTAHDIPTPSAVLPPVARIKGLHVHTVRLSCRGNPPITIQTRTCAIDEEYGIVSSRDDHPPSSATPLTTRADRYLPDHYTVEEGWSDEDLLLLLTLHSPTECVGWSFARYSDRREQLALFTGPVPSDQILVSVLEEHESRGKEDDYSSSFPVLPGASLHLRYYDTTEPVPRFSGPIDRPVPLPRLPTGAFRHGEMKVNTLLHSKSKSITLHIDGARYLPSCVTVSRVIGRLFDASFTSLGCNVASGVVLESDVFNPVYKYSLEIPGDVPATATVAVKIYTIHSITGSIVTVGYTLLNIFNRRGTLDPATAADSLSLNAGAFQLPLHGSGPDASQPLSARSLDHLPRVPGAWLLARISYSSEQGSSRDLLPVYSEGGYTDGQRESLSDTETYTLDSHRQRAIKPGVRCVPEGTDNTAVLRKLTRLKGQTVPDLSLSHVMEYSMAHGIGVTITELKNYRPRGEVFVFVRLCTPDTVHSFTDCIVWNSVPLDREDDRFRWRPEVHTFLQVRPTADVFLLIQVVEHSTSAGWRMVGEVRWAVFEQQDSGGVLPLFVASPSTGDVELGGGTGRIHLKVFDSRLAGVMAPCAVSSSTLPTPYTKLANQGLNFICRDINSKLIRE